MSISTLSHNTIITVNRRLALYLQERHALLNCNTNPVACPTLNAQPLRTWLRKLWQEQLETARVPPSQLLNTWQQVAIWENIIAQNDSIDIYWNSPSLIKSIIEADKLIYEWDIEQTLLPIKSRQEYEIFQQWRKKYHDLMKQKNMIDDNSLLKHVSLEPRNASQPIFHAGFDEFPPSYQRLFSKINAQPYHFDCQYEAQNTRVFSYANTYEEISAMAYWCKDILHKRPQAKIACLVPKLEDLRSDLKNTFLKIFNINEYLHQNTPEPYFNISTGVPLSDFPIINDLLNIFKLKIDETASIEAVNSLLRSPYISGSTTEIFTRSYLHNHLINRENKSIATKELPSLFTKSILKEKLQNLFKIKENFSDYLPASHWHKCFTEQANCLGWPGEKNLSSLEYQLVTRFQNLLEEFSSLDHIGTSYTYKHALAKLQNMCQQTLFQPQQIKPAPIQILGLLEAGGLQFDYLWIMDMHDGSFPAIPKPNPFIPIEIQKKHNMPHSSAERELHFAKLLMSRFLKSAPEIIFSYSLVSDDRELRPSPLLNPYMASSKKVIMNHDNIEKQLFGKQDIDFFIDENAPRVDTHKNIIGGTSLIKEQAQCPFRAFAKFRLKTEFTDAKSPGLSAKERGSIVHKLMELLWVKFESYDYLCSLDKDKMTEIINKTIHDFFEHDEKNKQRLYQIEGIRLQNLFIQWFTLEQRRTPFTVIASEQKRKIQLSSLELDLQIDRIDLLEDGKHLIIDYKTGNPSIQDWFGKRPNEPQLPIYCLSDEIHTSAIAFAQINHDKVTMKGISNEELSIAGIKPITATRNSEINHDWQAQIDSWHKTLNTLAQDFIEGKANVDPKQGDMTCQYCQLTVLCRIKDRTYES